MRDRDQPDRERDPPGVEQPAEDVPAGGVGAEDVVRRAVPCGRAEMLARYGSWSAISGAPTAASGQDQRE